MSEEELRIFLKWLDLDLVDATNKPEYKDRKGQVFEVVRDGQVLCSYASIQGIRWWMKRQLFPQSSEPNP